MDPIPKFSHKYVNFCDITVLSHSCLLFDSFQMVLVSVTVVFNAKSTVLLTWEMLGMHKSNLVRPENQAHDSNSRGYNCI